MSSLEVKNDSIVIENQKIHIDIYTASKNPIGTVLFLHGNIFYSNSYNEFLSNLSQVGNINVVTFDYLGWGRSEGPRGKAQAKKILEQIREMVKYTVKRFPNSKYAIIGDSMGGHFAFEALIDNPELDCCVSHTIRYPGTYANMVDRIFVNLFRIMGLIMPNKTINPLKEAVNAEPKKGGNPTYNKLLKDPKIVTSFDMKTIAELTRVKSNKNHKTKKPVLIIVGEKEENKNEIILAKKASQILTNSQLEVVKDAGHLLFIDHPKLIADLITNWLKKVSFN
ncbi:alpha/beta hydrolase [Desulfitibacter alkalitolerans]|uniref:alpha/beta hydrolase n=1 Tax=Desulfitibacter alkalitolerans TaxID=264641 RepID=UPI000485BC32|nr:alpha/beta hydrolase [Desulfitibacter alkalitolerans]